MIKTTKLLPIKVSPGVEKALVEGTAVLAMESTVLTHGLPYPRNFEVLSELEELCRNCGAEPATIIILDGVAHIGMEQAEISSLKEKMQNHAELHKFGRRELPTALVKGLSGGTTVSATMLLAHYAGIKVFATGGIGGVHRGWENTLDISSDLKALSQIPVIVVSAGCKAILDIPATMEYMESLGIPVIGWKTSLFPAFYSRSSGISIDRVDNATELAEIYRSMIMLDPNPSGILLANPVPIEDEISSEVIALHISNAINSAKQKGIHGKELTPYLLAYLSDSTQGVSVTTNLSLLRNNVIVGASVAKELI